MCCIFLQEAGTGHRIPPMSGIHLGVGSWKLFKLIKGGFVKSKNDCKSDPCGWTRRSHLFDTAREGHSHFHTPEQRRKNISFLFKTLSRATHSPLQDLTEVAFAFSSYLRSDICCSQLHSWNSSSRKLKIHSQLDRLKTLSILVAEPRVGAAESKSNKCAAESRSILIWIGIRSLTHTRHWL